MSWQHMDTLLHILGLAVKGEINDSAKMLLEQKKAQPVRSNMSHINIKGIESAEY